MKIAVTIWENRVSPVMDTARQLLVAEIEGDMVTNSTIVEIPPLHFSQKARMIAELGIETLICGAVSRPMEQVVTAFGVNIIPWIRGNVEQVIEAYINGTIFKEQYMLPGCHRRGRGRRHMSNRRGGRRGKGLGMQYKEEI